MASIGIDELELRTREVLRRVRENGETIDVTDGGNVVARVVPASVVAAKQQPDDAGDKREAMRAWLRDVDEFAHEIAKRWPKGVSAVDAVRDVRRDL